MGELKLATWPDPVLTARALEFTAADMADAASLAAGMSVVMRAQGGIGLAAPQVGVLKRLIVGCYEKEGWTFMLVNPRIVAHGKERKGQWEGCLSLPGERRFVMRHREITVEGLDLLGNRIAFKARNLLAAVLQHEIEHLDGVLMTNRTGQPNLVIGSLH